MTDKLPSLLDLLPSSAPASPDGSLAALSIFGLATFERRVTVTEEVRRLASIGQVEAVRPARCPHCGRTNGES